MAADVHQRVTELENEMKVLKHEIKAVLLDIREQYLNAENPFTVSGGQAAGGGSSVNISMSSDASRPAATHEEEIHREGASSDIHPALSSEATSTHADSSSLFGAESALGPSPSTMDGLQSKAKEHVMKETAMTSAGLERSADMESSKKGAGMALPGLEPSEEDRSVMSKVESHVRREAPRKRVKQTLDYRNSSENGAGINLITVAGLSRWVDDSVEKIGKERTEVMVEACYVVGYLPEELKDLLIRLVRLGPADEPKKRRIATEDYLSVIAQLDSLLGFNSESDKALLSILTSSREVVPSHG